MPTIHRDICYYNYNMLMKKKNSYAAPACDAVEVLIERELCTSIQSYKDGGMVPFEEDE